MLNELYLLQQSLREAGINPVSCHGHWRELPNAPTFRLFLAKGGTIAEAEQVSKETAKTFRKYEKSNGFSFPSLNIPALFSMDTKQREEFKRDIRQGKRCGDPEWFTALLDSATPNWKDTNRNKITKSLQAVSNELAELIGEIPAAFAAFSAVIQRAQQLDAEHLHEELKRITRGKLLARDAGGVELLEHLLLATKTPAIVLEVAETGVFEYPANHPKTLAWINGRLLASDQGKTRTVDGGHAVDPYGVAFATIPAKFPQVKLPILGKVVPRALNKESPCYARYGVIEAASFPVASSLQQEMKSAVEWLSAPGRQGKTWQDISRGCGYSQAVLFAYPSSLPAEPPAFAALFGGNQPKGSQSPRFATAAKPVIAALSGLISTRPEAEIRVFALAKADTARTKILANRGYSAQRLLDAAEAWQRKARNVPPIRLRMRTKGGVESIIPHTPFPMQVMACLNTMWFKRGTESKVVTAFGVEDALSLLVGDGPRHRATVDRALSIAVKHWWPLVAAAGEEDVRRDGSFRPSPLARDHLRIIPVILGIALAAIGHNKGEYMETAASLVGRFLSLADTLHKEYCHHVRNKKETGSYPQLLGNAHLAIALSSPQDALSRLGDRIGIYQSWANSGQGQDLALAKWSLRELGEVADELRQLDLPIRLDDAGRARLLLGYLARPRRQVSDEKTNPDREE